MHRFFFFLHTFKTNHNAVLLNRLPHQAASSFARKASFCSTPRPSSSGCSAASSCCFMGPSPLSLLACLGTQWPCWPEEERWGLAGENTKWTLCRCPVRTRSLTLTLTLTHLRTCPYCSLSTSVASHTPAFALRTLMVTMIHFQSGGCCRARMNVCLISRGICSCVCLRECLSLTVSKEHVCILHKCGTKYPPTYTIPMTNRSKRMCCPTTKIL